MERRGIVTTRCRMARTIVAVAVATAAAIGMLSAPILTSASPPAWRTIGPPRPKPSSSLWSVRHAFRPSSIMVRGGSDSMHEDQADEDDDDGENSNQVRDEDGKKAEKSPKVKKPSSRQEDEVDDEEGEETEDADPMAESPLLEEEDDEAEEEEEDEQGELEDDGYIQVNHDELLEEEDDDASEDASVVEETTIEDRAVAEEGQDEEQSENDNEVENDPVDDISGTESLETTHDVLERATAAGINADDENSSAFVDRMELADAYDHEEETVAEDVVEDAQAMAAVMAATAVGAGGSDPGEVMNQTPEPSEEVMATGVVKASGGESNIPTIPEDTKNILLKQLKFKPSDLKVLRPDIADRVVANRLQRPIEGMPRNWYLPTAVAESKSTASQRRLVVKASLTVATIFVATLLVVKGQDMGILDLDDIRDALLNVPAALTAVPATIAKSFGKDKGTRTSNQGHEEIVVDAQPSPTSGVETGNDANEEELEPASASASSEMDSHPRSVKPGASEAPAYEQDLDKTWLDKLITKMENALKAFFRIKI